MKSHGAVEYIIIRNLHTFPFFLDIIRVTKRGRMSKARTRDERDRNCIHDPDCAI
jgi:hypothetical protein